MITKPLFRLYAACLSSVLAARAADYYVAVGGTGDYTQGNPGCNVVYATKALATNSGDVVHLATGTYNLTGNYFDQYRHIDLKGGVTLIGGSDNPAETRLVGDKTTRVIYMPTAGATIRNLTVANGYTAWQAAGICGNAIDYVVSNCVVEGCTAKYRGGGACCGTWYDSVIRNCNSINALGESGGQDGSGGGIYGGTLYNCVITNNSAAYLGGGVAGGSGNAKFYVKAYNCTIGRNTAPYGGGAGAYTGYHSPASSSTAPL